MTGREAGGKGKRTDVGRDIRIKKKQGETIMTDYIDQILNDPLAVKERIQRVLSEDSEGEGLEDHEIEMLREAVEIPTSSQRGQEQARGIRGEGGSGEKRRDIVKEIENKQDAYGRSLVELKDGEEETGGSGGEEEEGTTGASHEDPTPGSEEGSSDRSDYRVFLEEKLMGMVQEMTSMKDRIHRLEMTVAQRVPLGMYPRSPPRSSRDAVGSTTGGDQAKKRLVSLTSPKPLLICGAAVGAFMRANPTYPSITGIRKAKLRGLALQVGVSGEVGDVSASQWTESGIKKWIEEAGKDGEVEE